MQWAGIIPSFLFLLLRSGARDPEADFEAQTGAEEAADAPRGGAAAGGRPGRPALRPPVWGAPPAAGEGEGGALSEREGASQTEVGNKPENNQRRTQLFELEAKRKKAKTKQEAASK